MKDGLVDILRALKNPTKFGLIVGEITADLPDIKINIGNGVILDKDDLLFSAGILKDYAREYSIESEDTQIKGNKLDQDGATDFLITGIGLIQDTLVAGATPPTRPVNVIPEGAVTSWSTKAISFDIDSQDFKSTGTITLTDQIKTGDKVVLMATESNQLFYVMDKVISF